MPVSLGEAAIDSYRGVRFEPRLFLLRGFAGVRSRVTSHTSVALPENLEHAELYKTELFLTDKRVADHEGQACGV